MTEGNGWNEWQQYVLAGLTRVETKTDCLDAKIGNLRVEVGKLTERVTLRATVVGLLAGGFPLVIALLLRLL